MVSKISGEELSVTVRFGGGLNTRASEDEIDPREAADGQNFLLDLENRELRPRPPFDLVTIAPNGSRVNGFASLLKSDGSVSLLCQAGDTVYSLDSNYSFTNVGTVNSAARLRGHFRSHNWTLDDKVLITDLALMEQVKEFNGTTFQDVSFTDENDSAFGNFFAKYCFVANERANFGHVKDDSSTTRHMIVGSKRGDYTNITVANRPASSLNEQDPYFLLTPDLKPINGLVEAFGNVILSSEKGDLFNLTGVSAKDFAFETFYPLSGSSGNESIAYIGNDILYGRPGRIESVADTDRFGDSEADDVTRNVADTVEAYTGWTIVYNSRLNRVYAFPESVEECWVLQTSMLRGERSPWMRWTTQHSLGFQPTTVMSVLDPADNLEYVFMGDSSGNIYRLEGTGASGDGGSADIVTEWLTRLHSAPLDAEVFDMEGYIKYRRNEEFTVDIEIEFAGTRADTDTTTITLPGISGADVYGGDVYYGGDFYYGEAFANRLTRHPFGPAGQSEEFQVRCTSTGTTSFRINEIGLRFKAASD